MKMTQHLNKIDKIINNFEIQLGKKVKRTILVEKLVDYVHKLSYNQGYNAGKKKGELLLQIDETIIDAPKKNSKPSTMLTRLAKAQELLKEKVLFIASYRDAKDNPVHGNIYRYRDGLKVGEFNHVDQTNNFVVINDKRINI